MSNCKYFSSTIEYNDWFKLNNKALILEITKIGSGILIRYINTVYKCGRKRTW